MTTALLPGDTVRIKNERGVFIVLEVTTGHVLDDDKLHPVAKLFGGTRGAERYRNRPVEQLRKIRKPKR